MRYLKRYNENVSSDTCKLKTGYSQQELKDIYMLNLEGSNEFDVLGIEVRIWTVPAALTSHGKIDNEIHLEIEEDFGANSKFDISEVRILSSGISIPIMSLCEYASNLNKRLIDMVGRKYDLEIEIDPDDSSWSSPTTLHMNFKISKKNEIPT